MKNMTVTDPERKAFASFDWSIFLMTYLLAIAAATLLRTVAIAAAIARATVVRLRLVAQAIAGIAAIELGQGVYTILPGHLKDMYTY